MLAEYSEPPCPILAAEYPDRVRCVVFGRVDIFGVDGKTDIGRAAAQGHQQE